MFFSDTVYMWVSGAINIKNYTETVTLCVYVCIVLICSAAKLQVCFNKLTSLYFSLLAITRAQIVSKFKSNQIKFIEQQRARGASYRLLKHKINNYYMYTLCAKK